MEAVLLEGETLDIYGYQISLKDGCVCTDRSRVILAGSTMAAKCKTPYVGERCEVEVYMESNVAEVYINDGQYVITSTLQKEWKDKDR